MTAPGPPEAVDGVAAEVVLADDPHRRVVRIQDTIRRPLEPWSDSVHALLGHLAAVGFTEAPRFLGVDEQGREVLSAIDGVSGSAGWAQVVPEDGLRAMARLLRRYHEAVADLDVDGLVFAGTDDTHDTDDTDDTDGPPAPGAILCHGDFGPWNLVWRGGASAGEVMGEPVGVIDWDYAWLQPPRHDVCYALEYVAPFRDDAECLRWLGYPEPPDRRRRIEVFAEAYGWPNRPGLVDDLVEGVIEQQHRVAERALRLAAEGHQPQQDWVRDGYRDVLAGRIAWSETHRDLFRAD